jgi:hypothetical protein
MQQRNRQPRAGRCQYRVFEIAVVALESALMKRVFATDLLVCDCGGAMRILVVLPKREAGHAILENLGLPSEPPAPRTQHCNAVETPPGSGSLMPIPSSGLSWSRPSRKQAPRHRAQTAGRFSKPIERRGLEVDGIYDNLTLETNLDRSVDTSFHHAAPRYRHHVFFRPAFRFGTGRCAVEPSAHG